ncbi:hypothetical protein DFH09DRAFT_1285972 [Mycena vulgaris]|nr:hypothetical protein DFH09DRAFT_1285972 [Mycena vulgaris]
MANEAFLSSQLIFAAQMKLGPELRNRHTPASCRGPNRGATRVVAPECATLSLRTRAGARFAIPRSERCMLQRPAVRDCDPRLGRSQVSDAQRARIAHSTLASAGLKTRPSAPRRCCDSAPRPPATRALAGLRSASRAHADPNTDSERWPLRVCVHSRATARLGGARRRSRVYALRVSKPHCASRNVASAQRSTRPRLDRLQAQKRESRPPRPRERRGARCAQTRLLTTSAGRSASACSRAPPSVAEAHAGAPASARCGFPKPRARPARDSSACGLGSANRVHSVSPSNCGGRAPGALGCDTWMLRGRTRAGALAGLGYATSAARESNGQNERGGAGQDGNEREEGRTGTPPSFSQRISACGGVRSSE